MRWRNSGIDRRFANRLGKGLIVKRINFKPGQRGTCMACVLLSLHDAQILRDTQRGARMVAGDHDHADARAMRLGHRSGDTFARWVNDANGANKNQIAFERFAPIMRLALCQGAVSHRQRSQCRIGKGINLRDSFCAQHFIHGDDIHAHPHLRAVVQQFARSPLGDQHGLIAVVMVDLDGRHHFAL